MDNKYHELENQGRNDEQATRLEHEVSGSLSAVTNEEVEEGFSIIVGIVYITSLGPYQSCRKGIYLLPAAVH